MPPDINSWYGRIAFGIILAGLVCFAYVAPYLQYRRNVTKFQGFQACLCEGRWAEARAFVREPGFNLDIRDGRAIYKFGDTDCTQLLAEMKVDRRKSNSMMLVSSDHRVWIIFDDDGKLDLWSIVPRSTDNQDKAATPSPP